jgi:uncharacterized cupin superfamily protein
MQIPESPFSVIDWTKVPPVSHPGEEGTATSRTHELGNIRLRMVEYSPGYRADHWCSRGHLLYVVEGEMETELKDGRSIRLSAGMSYCVSDSEELPHRSSTAHGAKLLIVD